ncbi:hypothetical protein EOD39_16945 [Acipenser ruthenus]|uniref:Myb/SANT-like DNA-binding domain-containing protein n=1 Tax=Acipenser ruthenus TaxID=7906 RepID=A0A444V4N0_ACIRT|nr:hypothetical protein EOD39_16945 [Acipenser ruthenus]
MSGNGKVKKINFSEEKKLAIVEEVIIKKEIILGRLGVSLKNLDKNKAWQEITGRVNAINPAVNRTVNEILKKLKNLLAEAKKEYSKKKPKTGGGPFEKLSQLTSLIIDIYGETCPIFNGIEGGAETGIEGATVMVTVGKLIIS